MTIKHNALRIIPICIVAIFFLWLTFGYFGIQALFTDKIVQEVIPAVVTTSTFITPQTEHGTSTKNSPQLLASGDFRKGDSTYTITGTARIIKEGEQNLLALENFDVTNGPDLFVYLVSASSTENTTVKNQVSRGAFVSLGDLKGNQGNQVYVIPPTIDLTQYNIVSIWCRRFSRNFGVAELRAI